MSEESAGSLEWLPRGSQKVAGEPPRAQKIIDGMAGVLIFGALGLPISIRVGKVGMWC